MSTATDENYDLELFDCADACASDTFPTPAGDLKRGDHVAIRGRPCKIVEIELIKTGKHGACKACIAAEDIFTGRRFEVAAPGSHPMPCPFVAKAEYLLVDIAGDGALSLLDEANEQRCDLDLPLKDNEPLARAIRAHFAAGKTLMLTTHKAMGVEQVMAFKYDSAGR
jgi:translation initiation factor 5A